MNKKKRRNARMRPSEKSRQEARKDTGGYIAGMDKRHMIALVFIAAVVVGGFCFVIRQSTKSSKDIEQIKVMLSPQQMENREETVQSLIEKAQALDLDLQGGRTALLELKALAEQVSAADQDREDRLARSIDGLKNAVLKNDNLLLQEIMDEAAAEIKDRFQDRLSKRARDSIVTALFTLNFYKTLNRKYDPLIEYSGVVILAASALETELHSRIYAPLGEYIKTEYGQEPDERLTLKSFGYAAGIWAGKKGRQAQKEQFDRFNGFIQKNRSRFSADLDSLFQNGTNSVLRRGPLEQFARRLSKLGDIRNDAAHIKPVTLEKAEEACQLAFLSSRERADQVTSESISLLEWLLRSCSLR